MNGEPGTVSAAARGPRFVRETLQAMGPAFIKLAQFLSLRPDLIPAEYCKEFLLLTDQIPPIPFERLRGVIEDELGDLGTHFAFFDTRVLAAGSLAQVHVARTIDGDQVAVKIQRPGVDTAIRSDLRKANAAARLISLLGISAAISPKELATQFEEWLTQELDLQSELHNVMRMRELCRDSDIIVVPEPYPELSSQHIVTCERLIGTPFSEILRNLPAGRASVVDNLGYDLDLLAQNLLHSVLIQIFRYQFFHSDMHPGNLLALSNGRIGLLDFALTDSLDPVIRRATARYLAAVADEDIDGMYSAVADVLRVTDDSDLDSFRADFTAATRSLLRDRARSTEGAVKGRLVRSYMVTLMSSARSNGLRVPPAMLSVYRSLLAAEAIANMLSTSADLLPIAQRFFRRLQLESALSPPDPVEFQRLGLQFVNLFQRGPGQLARLLDDLAAERFVLRVRSADASERRRQHNARAQLITLGLVVVGLSVLVAGAPVVRVLGWLPIRTVLIAMLAFVYAMLIFRWRGLR